MRGGGGAIWEAPCNVCMMDVFRETQVLIYMSTSTRYLLHPALLMSYIFVLLACYKAVHRPK